MLIATALVVAGFSVVALNASPAFAGTTSHGQFPSPDVRLSSREAPPGTWSGAEEVPGTAPLNAGGNAGIYSISCSSSGNCSAGGNYVDGSGHSQAFVVNEANGTWDDAIEVPGSSTLNVGGSALVLRSHAVRSETAAPVVPTPTMQATFRDSS
jgi:hypothetical protein